MTSADEFNDKSLIELAVLCGKVAGSSSVDPKAADKAHALRMEWIRSQQCASPKDLQKLKDRMAEFLATALPPD